MDNEDQLTCLEPVCCVLTENEGFFICSGEGLKEIIGANVESLDIFILA